MGTYLQTHNPTSHVTLNASRNKRQVQLSWTAVITGMKGNGGEMRCVLVGLSCGFAKDARKVTNYV